MAWTDAHQHCLDTYAATFGLPALDNETARAWTLALAQQFKFTFPSEGWGHKQADPGRPPSTDCIATQSPFTGYDVIVSQGAPTQTLAHYPEGINLTGQIYIPVEPYDHLSSTGGVSPNYPSYEELGGDAGGVAISMAMEADYKRAGRPGLDGGCGAWMQRTAYDFLTGKFATVEESIAAHRAEWCAELGVAAT